MTNKSIDASSLRLPSAEVVALFIAIASLLLGFLVPIYTDEVVWRFQARSAIDGGVDRFVAENCGPNTLAIVPLFIQPLRYASATVNLAFADPIFVRLTGVTFSLVWLTILWKLTGAIAQTTREKSMLRVLAFSLSSFGVLPFLLVLSRPEQPILLALTVSLVVAKGAWTRSAPDSARTAAGRAAIVVTCGAMALSYHLKGIVYMPMFLLCAGLSSSGRASVWARIGAVAALVGLSAVAIPYWVDRFKCPADPVLAARLANENIAAILFGGGSVISRMGEALRAANILVYVGLSMPAERYMSNWLPPDVIDHKEAIYWAGPLLLAWIAAMLLGVVSTGRALVRAARACKMDVRLMLPILLIGIVFGWSATQLNKNAYEASLAVPAMIIFIVLAIRAAELSEIMIKCAQVVSRFTLVVAAASLVALLAFYAKPLWISAHQPGYVAMQPYSVSPYGFSKIEDQIVATGRLCGIDPAKRPSGLLIDDLTYFAYMTSYRPLHRTGVLSDWNGSIFDPVAYLATRRSSGIVLGCSYLPPAQRRLAHSNGQFCCIGPQDWSQRSPRGQ